MGVQIRDKAYNFLTYVKVVLLQEVLQKAQILMYLDTDLLVFKNPWTSAAVKEWLTHKPPSLVGGSKGNTVEGSQGSILLGGFDILFQLDMMNPATWSKDSSSSSSSSSDNTDALIALSYLHAYDVKCMPLRNLFNSGQMLFRNSSRLDLFFAHIHSRRSVILQGHFLEQEIMAEAVAKYNLSACQLPYRQFTSWDHVCGSSYTANQTYASVVTFHAAGVGEHEKHKVMLAGLSDAREDAAGLTLGRLCSVILENRRLRASKSDLLAGNNKSQ